MAKKTFRDLLVKLNNVFSSDMYLVNCLYVIAGKESDEDNKGYYLCKLTPELISICKDGLDPNKVYFISDIRSAKDDLSTYMKEVESVKEIDEINKRIKFIEDYVNKTETWNNFPFTEIDIKNIFSDGLCEDFFEDDDNTPTITLSKSLFPLVTEKNVNRLYYNFFVKEDYADLLVSFDFDFFNLYMVYRCMDLNR
jgi:hypothetical protein